MFPSIARSLAFASASLVLVAAPLPAQMAQGGRLSVPSRIVAPINESSRVVLHGYIRPLANAANDRGAAPDSMPVERLHLVLKRSASQEAALQQLVAGLHTLGNANYHKWLTPNQFGQQFGPSEQDIATVESWLSSHGFQVAGVKPGSQVIEFSGNVGELRDAFHAQIHRYEVNGSSHYATATDPDIPSALAPVVGGFVSLDNFRPKTSARVLGTASYNSKTDKAVANWTTPNGTGYNFVLSPADFAVQYDLPTSPSLQGQGESIAILDFSNINVDLVNQFRSLFGLPTNPPQVIIDGNDPGIDGINNPDGPDSGSSLESYLDVEWAGAVAPQANIELVIAADTALETGALLAAEHAVFSDIAPIISSSIALGGCEAESGSLNAYMNSLWEEAAAQGQTVVIAAGDDGSAGCDNPDTQEYAVNGLGVSSWASTPYDVAVGGTDFYYSDYASGASATIPNYWNTTASVNPSVSIKGYIPEQPWNDSQFGLNAVNYYDKTGYTSMAAGSGGASSAALCSTNQYNSSTGACTGASSGYAKPSWQSGTGVPTDKVRDLPDVSLFAADDQNYSYYPICAEDGDCQTPSSGSQWQITGVGGTSAAAPSFAAIMALVDQEYGPQGQADFVLYPLKAQYPAAFHDIVQGTNSVPCQTGSANCIGVSSPLNIGGVIEGQIGTGTTPDYNAAAGYNLATGLGSVDANQLITDWSKVSFTTSAVTLTSPTASSTFTHGQAVTFSGSVSGSPTPTGNVAIMTSSTEPGNQGQDFLALNSSGNFSGSISYLPGGTYNVWANYGGDTKNAQSASSPVSITISPEASEIDFNPIYDSQSAGGYVSVSSQTLTYGTQIYLSAQPVPTSAYQGVISCQSGQSSTCPTYTYATGTVSFTDNGTAIHTATLNAEGDAEFSTGTYTPGTHSVAVSYSGDNSYKSSTATAVSFTVSKAQPTVFVTGAATTVNQGQGIVLDVLVEGYGIGAAPTGTVTLSGLPSGVSGSLTLSPSADYDYGVTAGMAVVTLPSTTAAGTYTITGSYSGDSNYTTATIAATTVTVASAATGSNCAPALGGSSTCLASTTTATATGTSTSPTGAVTINVSVAGIAGKAMPTGIVDLLLGGLSTANSGNTASANPIAYNTLTNGTTSIVVNSELLGQGANLLTVYYIGDLNYAASSTTLSITNALSDFALTAASSIVPVTGGTGTTSVYLTPVNGFNGTVALSCAPGPNAPSGLACSVSQSSVALTSSSTTTGPVSQNRRLNLFATGEGAALACVLLLTIPAKRRAWRNLLSLVLFICIAGFSIGCGGGSGSGTTGFGGSGGTGGTGGTGGSGTTTGTSGAPSQTSLTLTVTAAGTVAAGNYNIVVTGASSSTNQSHTLGVTANVQ